MKKVIRISSLIVLIVATVSYFDKYYLRKQVIPYPQFEANIQLNNQFLSIMTYNIRFNFLDFNKQSWVYRKEKLLNNIILKNPDILSIQEDTYPQVEYLAKHLSKTYSYVGLNNEIPEKSQHNCIFYNKKKFIAIYNKTLWLNENQTVNQLGWDGWCPRSTTIAIFRTISSPFEEFIIINAHLDHRGKKARIGGIQLILNFVKELIKERYDTNPPIFLMGDLNESPKQKVDNIIINEGYTDMWARCKINEDCVFGEQYSSSFHYYFGSLVNNFFIRNLLHFIFYAHGGKFAEYNRYHIDHMYYLNGNRTSIQPMYASMPSDDLFYDKSGIYASDHFPLFGVFKLN